MHIHPALQTPFDVQRELAARARARRLERISHRQNLQSVPA